MAWEDFTPQSAVNLCNKLFPAVSVSGSETFRASESYLEIEKVLKLLQDGTKRSGTLKLLSF